MYQAISPVVTHLLAKEMYERSATGKPTALGTPMRYSSAYACARQQGYAAFDATPSNPMDEAGAWVTGMGTMVHEALQEAIGRAYPSAQFEVPSGTDNVSGSCDALIDIHDIGSAYGGTHVLYELKTMGTYSFDKQVGWNRMKGQFTDPEGPAKKAITQAGMNALGLELLHADIQIETVIMGSITFEALSVQKADKMSVSGYDRFLAEWVIPREEWEPLAREELDRMDSAASALQSGYLPDRIALDDDGRPLELNPQGSAWQCHYCQYRDLCLGDGQGQVYILNSNLTRRNED